jgi:hypothetical protein
MISNTQILGIVLIVAGGLLDLFGLALAPIYKLSWWPSGCWFLPLFLVSIVLWFIGVCLWYR